MSLSSRNLNKQEIVLRTEHFVKETLAKDSTGHDWWHISRVRNNALMIARGERADEFVVELAALLHDIADWKFHGGDENAGPDKARRWLESQHVDEPTIERVCQIIKTVSYKGAGVSTPMKTSEGMIVQDADRLDALGAIGIARTFAYGGHKGRAIYDPNEPPQMHETFEQYKNSQGHTINHFYEKLLLLKDRLNTQTAKKIAAARHKYMEDFLSQFFAEWEGRR